MLTLFVVLNGAPRLLDSQKNLARLPFFYGKSQVSGEIALRSWVARLYLHLAVKPQAFAKLVEQRSFQGCRQLHYINHSLDETGM